MADDVCYPWGLVNVSSALTSGLPVYFSVRALGDRIYDCVKFLSTGTSMTSFHVAVFKPSAANTLALVMDCGDVKAQLAGAVTLQTIALPSPIEAVAGDVFMVGLLSVGGTPPTVYRANAVAAVDITTGMVPELTQITAVGAVGSKSAFSASETISSVFNTNVVMRVWGALGTAAPPDLSAAYYVDTFNRIPVSHLVAPWGYLPSNPMFGIYNECASPNVGSGMPYVYWVPSIRSNDHYIQLKLGADMATAAGRGLDLYAGVRCSRGGTGHAVKLHVKSTGTRQFRIITVTESSTNAGLTERAAPVGEVPEFRDGDMVKLVASDTVYTAFHNDLPIVSWIDSGEIHPIDDGHRGVNMSTSEVSVADLQVVDNFECGDFGGGVQLIGLSRIPSTSSVSAVTVRNDVTLTPAKATLTLTGHAPTLVGGTAIAPPKATLVVTGHTPGVSVFDHPIDRGFISSSQTAFNTTGAPLAISWNTGSGGSILLVAVMHCTNGTNITTATPTVDGVAMTSVVNQAVNGNGKRLRMWALMDPPSGTLQLSLQAVGATRQTAVAFSARYSGVGGYSHVATAGAGNRRQLGVSNPVDGLVFQAFGGEASTGLPDYNHTLLGADGQANVNVHADLLIGEAGGGPVLDFIGFNTPTSPFGAVTVQLTLA